MRFELILCEEIFRGVLCEEIFRGDGVESKQVLVKLPGLPVKDEGLRAEVTVSFVSFSYGFCY